MTDNKNMTEIPKQKRIRAYAAFMDRKHQQVMLDEVLMVIPQNHKHKLYLYLGMMDSTIAEGYSDDTN